jgi:DNA-binding CsgD family transcriptional regulator
MPPGIRNLQSAHYKRDLNGSYSIAERLLPRHYQIMDLRAKGYNYKQIVEELGMSLRQVKNVCNTPQFQNALAMRRDIIEDRVEEDILKTQSDVLTEIKKATMSAVDRLIRLIDDDNPAVARQAANDILDRGGYPKVSRQENQNESTLVVDSEQAALLQTALKEIEQD